MVKDPKSITDDEEAKKVAKALGVDLDDDGDKKVDKEPKSKKTGTEAAEEEGRSGEPGKSKEGEEKDKKEEPDYKKMYSDATREFQEVWKPIKDKFEKIKEFSGKDIDDIVKEYEGVKGEEEDDKSKKDAPKKGEEVDKKQLSSLEERLEAVESQTKTQEEKEKLSAKQVVDAFREKYDMSEEDYTAKINPLLDGVKEMRKSNGDLYTLEEGLEMAYIIAHKDTIDKIVDQRIKITEKEKELASFAPTGKESSEPKDEGAYTEQQQEVAKKMGTDLTEEEEK